MTDKEKIKEEIERLYKHYLDAQEFDSGYNMALDDILKFIDSLPEEHNELKKDYRERYEKISQSDNFKQAYCNKSLGSEEHNEDLEEAANKYGKEEPILPESYNDGDIPDYEKWTADAFKVGAQWQKQQMMKYAVEGCSVIFLSDNKNWLQIPGANLVKALESFKQGDKVKIIIVKEEQQ